jgi:serine O-acetyltransferase
VSTTINGSTNRPTGDQEHKEEEKPQGRQMYYSYSNTNYEPPYPKAFYPDIDLSIPKSVYDDENGVDLVWDLLRYEAYQNQLQQHEPLLVSFLHSTILNHETLESSLAFLLANRLQSPAMMISTQLQALIYSTIQDCSEFRKNLRADIMAVRDRDPACHTLPDVFLYFKGFHALQSYRTSHVLWNTGRTVLAQYLQSQVSQIFQIDIHPNATIGSGIMLDHGTGIVIGETVRTYNKNNSCPYLVLNHSFVPHNI